MESTLASHHARSAGIGWPYFFGLSLLVVSVAIVDGATLKHDICEVDAQCLNGGRCRYPDNDGITVKHCHCRHGYGGARCEFHCPLDCQNGGLCRLDDKSDNNNNNSGKLDDHHLSTPTIHHADSTNPLNYRCKCMGYFTGRLCDVPYENCVDGRRCHNGGSCHLEANELESVCNCPEGYTGDSCKETIGAVPSTAQIQNNSASTQLRFDQKPSATTAAQTKKDDKPTQQSILVFCLGSLAVILLGFVFFPAQRRESNPTVSAKYEPVQNGRPSRSWTNIV